MILLDFQEIEVCFRQKRMLHGLDKRECCMDSVFELPEIYHTLGWWKTFILKRE